MSPSLSTDNMRYLTIEQTLADYREITNHVKFNFGNGNNPVITIGYALSASYAVWLRKLYPEDFNFVVASGAQLEAKLEFAEFYEDIIENFNNFATGRCLTIIDYAFENLLQLISDNRGDEIQEIFQLREPLDTTSPEEVSYFFEFLLKDISQVVHGGNEREIKEYCQLFKDDETPGVALQRFADVIGDRHGVNRSFNFTEHLKTLQNIDFNVHVSRNSRQELFLQCTQRSWFHTTTNMFLKKLIPLSYYTNLCVDVFENNFTVDAITDGNNRLNEVFGGRLPDIDNVMFINGGLNPYRFMRYLGQLTTTIFVLALPDYGVAQELFPKTGDSLEIEEVRQYIKIKVLNFINDYGF